MLICWKVKGYMVRKRLGTSVLNIYEFLLKSLNLWQFLQNLKNLPLRRSRFLQHNLLFRGIVFLDKSKENEKRLLCRITKPMCLV